MSPDLASAAPEPASLSFSGRGREFLGLLVTGSLFQIPTFGFYRFWLVTKLRRHLWANTRVAGESFEYTGTAKELLIGFFIALAILTPIYLGYFLLGIVLEEKKALASIPLVVVMYLLMHFAAYRARRYRATRTVFRGIRFWMTGKGWAYAGRAILWDVAVVLTLGLALPWAMASLERYRMRHTYYGSLQGDFTGTGWSLFKRGVWVWVLGLGAMIAFMALIIPLSASSESHTGLVLLTRLVPFAVMLVVLAVWPPAMAIFTRWQLEGIRFGAVAVASDLGKGAFYGTFLKLIGSAFLYVLCFGFAVGLIGFAFRAQFMPLLAAFNPSLAGDTSKMLALAENSGSLVVAVVLAALAYLVLLLGMGVIKRYFMGRGVWAVIVNSLAVTNLAALDATVAAGQPSGIVGEGLADALDFDVAI